MKNCIDIIRDWLETHGYDGLASDDCGCAVNDLFPCGGEYIVSCSPAQKQVATDENAEGYCCKTGDIIYVAEES